MSFISKVVLSTITGCILNSCGPGLSDYIKDLGDGYYFADVNAIDKTIYYEKNGDAKVVVGNLVVSYYQKGNYIVALRQPMNVHPHDSRDIFEKRCEYWLIDAINKQSFGPLEKKQYLMKIQSLGIPKGVLNTPASSGVPKFCFNRDGAGKWKGSGMGKGMRA